MKKSTNLSLIILSFWVLSLIAKSENLQTDSLSNDDWKNYFTPGIYFEGLSTGYDSLYEYDSFKGFALQTNIISWKKSNNKYLPGYFNFFILFSYLESGYNHRGYISYGLGVDFSFERHISRNYLIPFVGFEFLNNKFSNEPENTSLNPSLGILAYSSKYITIVLNFGIVYSLRAEQATYGNLGKFGINFCF